MYARRFSFYLVRDVCKIIVRPRARKLSRGYHLSPAVLKNSLTRPSVDTAAVNKTHRLINTLPSASAVKKEGKKREASSSSADNEEEEEEDDVAIPDPPANCCMSGCANCVWIEYGQELARLYRDGGRAAERVMRAVEDPGMRIFLSLELKQLEKDAEEEEGL